MYVSQSISVSAVCTLVSIPLQASRDKASLTWHEAYNELREDGIAKDDNSGEQAEILGVKQ